MAIDNLTERAVEATTDIPTPPSASPYVADGYAPEKATPARTGSAAMVVARAAGRSAGHLAVGLRGTPLAGWRYVRAHDRVESIEPSTPGEWEYIHRVRRGRWITSAATAGGGALVSLGAWVGMVAGMGLTAMPGLEAALGGESAAGIVAAALYGRHLGRKAIEAAPVTPAIGPGGQTEEDDGEPFPLAWCKDGEQVRICVQRALAAEGIGTRSIAVLGYRGWGWEIDVQLKGSTPGKVNAVADNIDTHLDLPQGGTLIEPDVAASAHIVLRLVISDPFADMPKPVVHAPLSLSVRDLAAYGRGMDGSALGFRLRGMSMLVIGSSGSAKTKGALRSIAEAITACRDAIAIEMDPVKDGLAEFEGAMAVPPIRGGEECTEWLARLKKIASVRNQIKRRLDMGDLWEPSPERPSIYAIVDEFIYLPKEAKAHAIELLRIGRETGVHLIFAAQEATEDALGDAVASAVTYRILLASRSEDVRLVFGKGASADGYRPDRLRPSVDDQRVYDAGKFYIKGPGFLRPIQWRWHRLDRDQIKQAVKARVEAGRPWFDHDSLAAAGLLHVVTRSGVNGSSMLADRLDALAAQGGVEDADVVALLMREFELSGEGFLPTAALLSTLGGAGIDMDSEKLGRLLRKHAPTVKAARSDEASGRLRGWERSAIEQAAAGLMDPVGTRTQAG